MNLYRLVESLLNKVEGSADTKSPVLLGNATLTGTNFKISCPEEPNISTNLMILCKFDSDFKSDSTVTYNEETTQYEIRQYNNRLDDNVILANMYTWMMFNGLHWELIGSPSITLEEITTILDGRFGIGTGNINVDDWTISGTIYEYLYSIPGILPDDTIIYQESTSSGAYCHNIVADRILIRLESEPSSLVSFNYIVFR